MINNNKKIDCCGCSACVQRCPKQCITMQEDEEGFLYPHVNAEQCINCGLCEKVCPCINQGDTTEPIEVYVAKHPDDVIRMKSSSGGLFSALAETIIREGGVVFGARFDEQWQVIHSFAERKEELGRFRGSKYLQSAVGTCFQDAESFLKKGRKVLFTGTPCQIAGLHHFLQKDYQNLLTVAIACHSVPSPIVWKEYLKCFPTNQIKDVNFRDKRISWERYGLAIMKEGGKDFFQEHDNNMFMQLFLHGIISRPSCFKCPAKDGKCMADIIIGDPWGISQVAPSYVNDHRGVSFVACLTERGQSYFKSLSLETTTVSYAQVIEHNGGLTQIAKEPVERDAFWRTFSSESNKQDVLKRFAKPYMPSLTLRIKTFIRKFI